MILRFKFLVILAFSLLFSLGIFAQEIAPVYTARAYWLEQQNPRYRELMMRQMRGDSIKPAELDWLNYYKEYLAGYYSKLSEKEKQVYQDKNKEWDKLSESKNQPLINPKQNDQYSDVGDRSIFTKYVVYSGYSGFYYGAALDVVFEINGAGAAGIPFLTAGACVLVPLLNSSNRQMSNNSLMLAVHGKSVGWMHGFAFSSLLFGNKIISDFDKPTLTIGALSSIGLGYLGKELGKNDKWTEGRVALYRHYGFLMPYAGASFLWSGGVNDIRVYGAGLLVSGMAGYYIAQKISDRIDYSRGDILSMKGLTLLNGGLGFGLWIDAGNGNRGSFYLPAIGALGGTLLGHIWLKDYNLSMTAARQTIYATIGGSLIGFGTALVINSSSKTPYYLIPWITGFVSYAIAVENVKTKPQAADENKKGIFRNLTADFEPQNLILGSRLTPKAGASPLSMRIQPPPALTLRYSIR
jgi:hypothetical protein